MGQEHLEGQKHPYRRSSGVTVATCHPPPCATENTNTLHLGIGPVGHEHLLSDADQKSRTDTVTLPWSSFPGASDQQASMGTAWLRVAARGKVCPGKEPGQSSWL